MTKYTLQKCSIDDYIARGGNLPDHFSPSTMYYLAQEGDEILGEIAFVEGFFEGWSPHYFILKIESHLEGHGIASALIKAVEDDAIENKIGIIASISHEEGIWRKLGYTFDEDNLALKCLEIPE